MTAIRVLELAGSSTEIGRAHGSAFAADIRRYCEERIRLVTGGLWSGRPLDRREVLAIAEDCVPFHRDYAPDLTTEMVSMGETAGLSPAEMIVVGGFTDFVDAVRGVTGLKPPDTVIEDDCTAFIVPDRLAGGAGFFGQTWDMHDTATEFVVLTDIRPENGLRALVFTTTGCLGQIGMNEAGVCVGINNLTAADGGPGVTWPHVVRRALEQTTAAAAREVIEAAPVAGAHSYLVFDRNGDGYGIERSSTRVASVSVGDEPYVHTNHMLFSETKEVEVPRPPDLQASSEARLERARQMLAAADGGIDIDHLIAVTRDEEAICQIAHDPFHIESCGAAIMRPRLLDFWAVWGLPTENEYERFSLAAEPA